MYFSVILFFASILLTVADKDSCSSDLSCTGRAHYNVTLTAYYPDFTSDSESDYLDMHGKKLRTLQDFIDGRASFVTVSMDDTIPKLTYGSVLCIPELNHHYGKKIILQVRDHDPSLRGKSYSRLDICVRTESDSYDYAVNSVATVYSQL